MSAITFDVASTQLANIRLDRPILNNNNDVGGRVRICKFDYTATGAVSSGSQIELLEFRPSTVIVGGAVTEISLSNSATADLGYTATGTPVDDNKDVFLDGVTAATEFSPAMVTTSEKTTLFATTGVGALASGDKLVGYVLYVDNT